MESFGDPKSGTAGEELDLVCEVYAEAPYGLPPAEINDAIVAVTDGILEREVLMCKPFGRFRAQAARIPKAPFRWAAIFLGGLLVGKLLDYEESPAPVPTAPSAYFAPAPSSPVTRCYDAHHPGIIPIPPVATVSSYVVRYPQMEIRPGPHNM